MCICQRLSAPLGLSCQMVKSLVSVLEISSIIEQACLFITWSESLGNEKIEALS